MNYSDIYSCVLYSTGKWYPKEPFYKFIGDLPLDMGGFTSLYQFTRETGECLRITGTTKGFKGVVWNDRLWLDFDTQEAGKNALLKVKEMEFDYVCYTSGGRGLHVGILRDSAPSHLLPLFDKKWAEKTFEGHDPSIYTHLHLFRLPGTIHEKTGLKKDFLERGGNRSIIADFSILENERSYGSLESPVYGTNMSIFDSKSVMYNSTPQENGQRHEHLIRCIYALKSCSVTASHARWWVGEVNKTYSDRKPEDQLDQLVKSIYG